MARATHKKAQSTHTEGQARKGGRWTETLRTTKAANRKTRKEGKALTRAYA